ncbi:hypothetical protein R1flu_025300 [Riccia fluitans]|uniref:HMA domain-containing protein n=1 Tax=Riccia fluitans TaxID=41844 RepID=A0ABD1XY95_9MARC
MMSMQDLFYSNAETLWVVKPPSEEEKKKKQQQQQAATAAKKEEYSILKLIPDYPYYYPDTPAPPPAPAKKDEAKKETKVTLKVSICCDECVEIISNALKELKGVKDVDCNIGKERVVVTCTTAAPGDVILAARKEFKHARLWTDDD